MAQNDGVGIGNDLGLKRVLLTRFSALGDVVMTIPVIYSACLCYPDVQFVLATRPSMATLFVAKPDNLTIEGIYIKRDGRTMLDRYKLMAGICGKYKFDAYIDLQNDNITLPMCMYARLHGIKTIKFNRALHHKRTLTRSSNKVLLPMVSSRARYREAFFNAGLPIDARFKGLYGHEGKGDAALFASITPAKTSGDVWIGVAPFAAYAPKEYPPEKMHEVIRMLCEHPEYRIFIFGGEGREHEIAAEWAKEHDCVRSLAGKRYGFPAELALLSHLDLMITMDSANMHLASIVGTPTLSVWGATHYYCGFKGWHQSETNMVQLPLSCRPCSLSGDKPCLRHDLLCLTAIRPETIYLKAMEMLTNSEK